MVEPTGVWAQDLQTGEMHYLEPGPGLRTEWMPHLAPAVPWVVDPLIDAAHASVERVERLMGPSQSAYLGHGLMAQLGMHDPRKFIQFNVYGVQSVTGGTGGAYGIAPVTGLAIDDDWDMDAVGDHGDGWPGGSGRETQAGDFYSSRGGQGYNGGRGAQIVHQTTNFGGGSASEGNWSVPPAGNLAGWITGGPYTGTMGRSKFLTGGSGGGGAFGGNRNANSVGADSGEVCVRTSIGNLDEATPRTLTGGDISGQPHDLHRGGKGAGGGYFATVLAAQARTAASWSLSRTRPASRPRT